MQTYHINMLFNKPIYRIVLINVYISIYEQLRHKTIIKNVRQRILKTHMYCLILRNYVSHNILASFVLFFCFIIDIHITFSSTYLRRNAGQFILKLTNILNIYTQ